MVHSDESLVVQAAGGDLSAFEELVNRYKRRVYTIALRMLGNPEDADDLSQEAFLRVYRSISGFKGDAKFSTWLYRVVSNLCIDFLRKRGRAVIVPLTSFDRDNEEREEIIPDERFAPDRMLENEERKAAIARAIQAISPAHREIFLLRESQDLSYSEIADVLGLEAGTVKSRLARAREALKNELLKDGNFSSCAASNEIERGDGA